MVYRISPENVRPPRGGPSGALAMVLVLAVVVGIWLLAGRDPGSSTFGGQDPDQRTAPAGEVAPNDPVSGLPYVSPVDLPLRVIDLLADVDTGANLPGGVTRRPLPNTTGVLPVQPSSGYYVEYDVGGGALLVTGSRGERYYSDDAGATYARVGP